MRKQTILAAGLALVLAACGTSGQSDGSDKVERIPRVEALLKQMTLEEKVGQMAQVTLDVVTVGNGPFHTEEPMRLDTALLRKALVDYKLGSILNTAGAKARTREEWFTVINQIQEMAMKETRLGIPVLYGVDAIHGVTYTAGSTLFPQQIGQAATWNREIVREGGAITAYETRASCTPWTFSPVLDMGRDARFPRMWESFGEDVYLSSQMAHEIVKGYEGDANQLDDPNRIASCIKHFLGYSVPESGKDRTPALIPEIELLERHVPPFAQAIRSGAQTLMVNSGLINGVPVHCNYDILTKLLKVDLGFTGLVVTDWKDIENIHTRDRVAASQKEAVKLCINAGIDMSMIPYNFDFCDYLIELVNEGEVSMARIDDAVRRILNVKHKLGLFERPVTHYDQYPDFGSEKFAAVARKAATESITLLKNEENVLPLPKNAKVLVTGPNANSMRTLNGGWSYSWQGDRVEEFAADYSTILEALESKVGKDHVMHVPGVEYNHSGKYWEDVVVDIPAVVRAAAKADYVLMCIGENSYCEKPGDLHDLSLSENQTALARALIATGKPVIMILNEGRPRIVRTLVPGCKGVLQTYLPGNYGGLALADILYGDANPSGKLPYTYPMFVNTLVTYDHKPSENQAKMQGMYDYESDFAVQWPFGHGLSYTTFTYSDLRLSSKQLTANDSIVVSVTVKNTGNREGMEVVQLYTSDMYASITPDVRRLRGFQKVSLQPDEAKEVQFTLKASDLSFINAKLQRVTEPGEFEVQVGGFVEKFEFQ
ncbi:MAG: glycoside hydrolase family 3 C-terminal domain-containing protein [Marinilabiliaceae bacterium]|nr:glycoside hydrolase family 3 C-terminal domain-containing protein [Marinilabiliaceae bacterium]